MPSHFIERHGAVIIVALGETIIALPAFNGFSTCRARVAPLRLSTTNAINIWLWWLIPLSPTGFHCHKNPHPESEMKNQAEGQQSQTYSVSIDVKPSTTNKSVV